MTLKAVKSLEELSSLGKNLLLRLNTWPLGQRLGRRWCRHRC